MRKTMEPAMSDATTTYGSDGYYATPIVEPWGDAGWKAGVLLSGGDARGDRPAKSLRDQLFSSREDAWQFAESEYGSLGRD
jgi:hypothetical protein